MSEILEILDMLDNKYGSNIKISIFTEDKLMEDTVYQARLYGGFFRVIEGTSKTELPAEQALTMFFHPSDLYAEYGALMCCGINTCALENEYPAEFIEENRSVVLRSYMRDLVSKAGKDDVISMMDFNTFLRQTILYQTSAKSSGGAIGSLAKRFQSLIFLPNMLGTLDGNLNYDTYTVKDQFNNYVFAEGKFPTPVAVENNAMRYSNERQDSAAHFTRVFRIPDLVNYFYDGDNSKERQLLMSNRNLLLELALLHYNPDIIELSGSHVFGANEEENKIIQRFIPVKNIDMQKLNTVVHKDTSLDNYKFKAIECEYLDYLSLQSYNILKPEKILNKLKGWEDCI